jgi:hypothetical protein
MNSDVILHWMTHLGEGSWETFKEGVERLAPEDVDFDDLLVKLRFHLSDLGHVDFFTGGSRRWRVLPPILAGLAATTGAAILSGGRTRRLHQSLIAAARRAECSVLSESDHTEPAIVRVVGASSGLAQAAAEVGVPFLADYASALCAGLTPLYAALNHGGEEPPPTNWRVESFDFRSMSLVDGLFRNSACEYSPRQGLSRWYLHTRHGRLRAMPKREAIYVAAMLQRVALLRYDASTRRLFAYAEAPLPESYSRVACLCSGNRPRVSGGMVVFEEVPAATTAVLCVAAGQRYPQLSRESALV